MQGAGVPKSPPGTLSAKHLIKLYVNKILMSVVLKY